MLSNGSPKSIKIFDWGVDPNYPEYLQQKIALTNRLSLLIGLVIIFPFIIISLISFPELAYIPILGISLHAVSLVLNYFGLYNLSRIITSLVPTIFYSWYGACLSNSGEPVIPAIAMLTLCFSFLPFLLFSLKERKLLFFTLAIVSISVISADSLNSFFELPTGVLETEIIKTGYLSKLSVIMSLIGGFGGIFILMQQNERTEKKSIALLSLAESNRIEMEAKEKDLTENLQKLEAAQEEERRRQWISDGLTRASKIIRDQKETDLLYNELLSFIVKYNKANQGGLFVLNKESEKKEFLELKAAYAFERKKFLHKRIEIGEGLTGQVFLEKEPIYFKKVPESYVSITSGLGLATPRVLLIVPLKINEDVHGVLELASFKEFASHEIVFLNQIGESIAAAIQSRRIDEQTRILVTKLNSQAKEMRAQEEEMRQNIEELSATQESQSRSQDELQQNREILNQKINELEEQKKILVLKEQELRKLNEKNIQKTQKFREQMEKLDFELEKKISEYNSLQDQYLVMEQKLKLSSVDQKIIQNETLN